MQAGNGKSWFRWMNSLKWSAGYKMVWSKVYKKALNSILKEFGVSCGGTGEDSHARTLLYMIATPFIHSRKLTPVAHMQWECPSP